MFLYIFIVLLTHSNSFLIINLAPGQFLQKRFSADEKHKNYEN